MKTRFPWILTVVAAALLVLLLSLGVWQVKRLAWKENLIARAEQAQSMPPRPLAEVIADANPEFHRAMINCPGLAHAPFVELQSIVDGQAGARLISACRQADGADWLIDRGFVGDTVSERPQTNAEATEAVSLTVVPRVTPPPGPMAPPVQDGRFYARDNAAIAAALGRPDARTDMVLFAETSSNPDWAPLRPAAPPAAFSNNHLGYAMTWFGLAAVLIGFYIALLRRRTAIRPNPAAPASQKD